MSWGECARLRENVPYINPLNAELNPIRHLLALEGAHYIVHVIGVGVKVHRSNPKELYPKLNGYGDNGERKA